MPRLLTGSWIEAPWSASYLFPLFSLMRLRTLQLRHFRSHTETTLDLASGMTLFLGPNGAGKTNVIEAISYLCLGKSVFASTDVPVLQRGATHLEVSGEAESDRGAVSRIRVAVVPGEGKRAFVNGAPLGRLADLVGRIPVVVLSPSDHELTAGGPSGRRQMLDATLSQAHPVYLTDLMAYRRVLKQRNALLGDLKRGASLAPGTMDAWDSETARLGARIVSRRADFLLRFDRFVAEAHRLLQEPGSAPSLGYAPSVDLVGATGEDAAEAYRQELARTDRRSRDTGRTLVGPHLDDITFRLDGMDLRPYASQGQHRTFSLALRIAQALFLHDHLDEAPLLLFDDVFGPLDALRSQVLIDLLISQQLGQSVVTAARPEPFSKIAPLDPSSHAVFHVERGAVSSSSL